VLSYDGSMRYAQRGGYTPAEQQRRERLRVATAERFARGDSTGQIAADLRVTERTVRRWGRAERRDCARSLQPSSVTERDTGMVAEWLADPDLGKAGPAARPVSTGGSV
jgi:hypothetical protein